jgi:fatty-acyl-CoA synthase
MLVNPGTLPKTSSGKLQRSKCKTEYLDEELELLDS